MTIQTKGTIRPRLGAATRRKSRPFVIRSCQRQEGIVPQRRSIWLMERRHYLPTERRRSMGNRETQQPRKWAASVAENWRKMRPALAWVIKKTVSGRFWSFSDYLIFFSLHFVGLLITWQGILLDWKYLQFWVLDLSSKRGASAAEVWRHYP